MKLICEVTRINPEAVNDRGMKYTRLFLSVTMKSGERKFAKTDAVKGFKNARRFGAILKEGVGAEFYGEFRDARTINADTVEYIPKSERAQVSGEAF